MKQREKAQSHSWYEQLPLEQVRIVNTLFPFKRPPLEVASNCLVVDDPRLQLSGGFHETNTGIFLSPRSDGKLLIPVEAFGRDYPEFNLPVIVNHTLPVTHRETGRRWAVWMSRIPFVDRRNPIRRGFTPELARAEVTRANTIKQIYKRMLDGNVSPAVQEELKSLMSQIIQGAWLRYYTEQLPKMIIDSKDDAEKIIEGVFKGLDRKIDRAIGYWEKLTPDDKKLLANAFRVVVKTKLSPPFAYFAGEADKIRKGKLPETFKSERARDPLEIVALTQGVSLDQVEAVYIHDDIMHSDVYPIVQEKMKTLGIDGIVRPYSELDDTSQYPTCDAPYAQFNLGLLAKYIKEERLVPLVPSEWKDSNVLKQG